MTNVSYPHNNTFTGLKVVGEVKKVGKSRNFEPKVGKSRNFSVFKVGKSRNFISFLSLFCILVCLICLFHLQILRQITYSSKKFPSHTQLVAILEPYCALLMIAN